jgi:hypothetical protein
MKNISDYVNEFPIIKSIIEKSRFAVKHGQSLATVVDEVDAFLKSDEPASILAKCVKGIVDSPAADFPFMQQDHIVLCNDFGGLLVALGRARAGSERSPLFSTTSEAILGALSPQGFSYRLHDVSEDWDHEIFSDHIRVGTAQALHCAFGKSILLSPSKVYDYASDDDVVLKVVAPPSSGQMWEFDRTTCRPLRVYASTIEATTLSYIVRFLSEYGNEQSAEAIKKLTKHPFHYVRWDAVKAIGLLAPETLDDVLKELEHDTHPHIRTASTKMRVQLGEHYGN